MSTTPFDRLTQGQRTALVAILGGDSPRVAAARANVTERTLRRWRREPDFQAAFAEARIDFFSACRSYVNSSLAGAFQTLVGVADYPGKPADQLKAATFLLNRIAPTRMSANSPANNAKHSHKKPLRRKFGRTRPDISGQGRTSPDIRGLQTDTAGR